MNIWRFWLQGQINSIFTVARDTGFNAAELGQPRYTEMRHWLQRVDADDVDSSQGQFCSNELRQREELQVVMSWLREQAASQQRHIG